MPRRKREAPSPRTPQARKRQRVDDDVDDDEEDLKVTDSEVQNLQAQPQSQARRAAELQQLLEEEKARYEGASSWAPEEERLFEYLFKRQQLALLPSHWHVDFRGVPLPDSLFRSSEENPPMIRSLCGKDFRASTALMRLIDLTSEVRTLIQSDRRDKAPETIRNAIEHYVAWATEDGGYQHMDYVPNLVVANVTGSKNIVSEVQWRMNTLARLQREFLRLGADSTSLLSSVRSSRRKPRSLRLVERFMRRARRYKAQTPSSSEPSLSHDAESKERSSSNSSDCDSDSDAETKKNKVVTPTKPRGPPASPHTPVRDTDNYRHTPPVVYGLFVMHTSILLLSIDSSKPEPAHVSYHVGFNIKESQQSVWNAMTIAMAICIARNSLIERMADFSPAPLDEESDPDA